MWKKLKNVSSTDLLIAVIVGVVVAVVIEAAKLLHWSMVTGITLAAGIAISAVFVKLIRSYRALSTQVEQFKIQTKELEEKAAESGSEIARLRARLDAHRESIPRRFLELVNDIAKDGTGHHYPYRYLSVEQDASIDRFGNYTAMYTHEAINDSGKAIGSYTFVIRTDQNVYFSDLDAKAFVKVDHGVEQEVKPSSPDLQLARYHTVEVKFPDGAVNAGETFKVRLSFTWPKAMRNGGDGDALDLTRFKSVRTAVFRLRFEQPVTGHRWLWKEPTRPDIAHAPVEHYPYGSHAVDGHNFEMSLPHPNEKELARTVYAFCGDFTVET